MDRSYPRIANRSNREILLCSKLQTTTENYGLMKLPAAVGSLNRHNYKLIVGPKKIPANISRPNAVFRVSKAPMRPPGIVNAGADKSRDCPSVSKN